MKTTLEIPDERLEALMSSGSFATKKEAVNTAIEAYLQDKRVSKLLAAAGSLDDFMSRDQLREYRDNG